MFKSGDKVRYTGPNTIAYETGKIYKIVGYDKELDMYGVMSELDESYCLPENVLEDIK